MKKRYIYMLFVCLATIALSSCDKWLNVEPNSQIRSSELFKTESGFKEALAGVYTLLTAERLYGKELQYGMMSVLSHEWSSYVADYNEDAAYAYESTGPQTRINNIWNGLYQAISNTNNIINEIESKRSLFSGDNFNIIKGEAFALRGFLHLELIRLFGASYTVDPSKPAIPYVVQYTPKQTAQSTVKQTYDLILKDLEIAREMLAVDPILTGREITEGDDNGYLLNRQLHLNYYAVEALLARYYFLTGEFDKARLSANTVISSGKFSYSTQTNLLGGIDRAGVPEHIFGLQINNLYSSANTYLSSEGNNVFSLSQAALDTYYDGATDYRKVYLFVKGSGDKASNSYLLKYSEPTTQAVYYRNKSPLIKLSEMHFIIAGSNVLETKSILTPINSVRQARGVAALTSEPTDPTALLITEFRKEFFGEGQLFHLYKRLNRNSIAGTDKDLVAVKAYTLPIPVAEYDAANRQNNR